MNKIGLVSCSKNKLTVPAPAYLIYKSPRFTQIYITATRRCDKVFILSAKHGVLEPTTIVHPYDCYLPDMDQSYIDQWAVRCMETLRNFPGSYYSFLPSTYREPLEPYIDFVYKLHGTFFQTAKSLGKTGGGLIRGNVMEWLLEFIYQRRIVTVEEITEEFTRRKYPPVTTNTQLGRIQRHPLLIRKGNLIRYKYL